MNAVVALVVGIVSGAIAIGVTLRLSARVLGRPEGQAYAAYLVVAALIYVGFAWGEGVPWIWVEWAGLVAFGSLAWVGRNRIPWLALAWALHVGWDLMVHGSHTAFVPSWYRWACVGFDGVVACWLLLRVESPAEVDPGP